MQLKKVKMPGTGRMIINFSVQANSVAGDFNMVSKDEPAPELKQAMEEIIPHALKICELPEKGETRVIGLSFSYHGDDNNMAVIISFKRKLSIGNAWITINTPMKYIERGESTIPESQVLEEGGGEIVKEIIEQTKEYINGVREQTNLFSE